MNELYKKIENYFQFEKADTIFVTLIKSLILLACGGYFGLILREYYAEPSVFSYKHIFILIVGILTYLYIEIRRLKKEKNFPVTILEHLKATEELRTLQEKYNRKTKIYDYIDHSIQSLNSNTCPVIASPDNFLCHQDLHVGLKRVLEDLVERPNYFFNIDKTKFTVGTYLKEVSDRNSQIGVTSSAEKVFTFRDDLHLINFIPQTFLQINSGEEESFQIQTAIFEAIKFNKYLCKKLKIENEIYSLICSPIPNVCVDCPPDGIIYTIYKGEEYCSNDSESVLLIFGRILSNWISKYNECVRTEKKVNLNQIHSHIEKFLPKEIIELNKSKEIPPANGNRINNE